MGRCSVVDGVAGSATHGSTANDRARIREVFILIDILPKPRGKVKEKNHPEFVGLGKGLGFWLDFSRFQGGGGWLELLFSRLKMNGL